MRAVHAKAQLREVMCAFWHDHFNVDTNNEAVGIDAANENFARELFERHSLGTSSWACAPRAWIWGGWDSHEHQPGRFKSQAQQLSAGLGALYNDLARDQKQLTLVVLTELGRRLRSNRSHGTDHSCGSLMLVVRCTADVSSGVGRACAPNSSTKSSTCRWPMTTGRSSAK